MVLGKDEYVFNQLRSDLNVVLKAEKNLVAAYALFAKNMREKIFTKEYIEAMKQIFLDTATQYENISKKRMEMVRGKGRGRGICVKDICLLRVD